MAADERFELAPNFQKQANAIKVAIADENLIFIKGASAVLYDVPQITFCASFLNGQALLDWYKRTNADVIVIDNRLPLPDGKETIKQLLNRFPDAKIIVFSAQSNPAEIRYMRNLGVCAYLLKSIAPDDLIKSIIKIYHGEKVFPKTVFSNIDSSTNDNVTDNKLSTREIQVLKLIAKGKNNKESAFELNISELTVKKHRENMMRKLGASNLAQLILMAGFDGYL